MQDLRLPPMRLQEHWKCPLGKADPHGPGRNEELVPSGGGGERHSRSNVL
jgi:hypothetical protein